MSRIAFIEILSLSFSSLLLLAFSDQAQAQTNVMFSRDSQKATVLLPAVSSNPDAIDLDNILIIDTENQGGKDVKRIEFVDESGNNPLDLSCAFSRLVPTTGSCFLVFHNTKGVTLTPERKTIDFVLTGQDAKRLATAFALPSSDGEFYRSRNGLLRFEVYRRDGEVTSLRMSYGL